jgi:Swt1-like HEPN
VEIDFTQALKDTENSLRDFIATILEKEIGPDWMEKCGASPDRLKQWRDRKDAEVKRQSGGVIEPRLIYYADFYDIQTILKKNWDKFAIAFGDWKSMEVFLSHLEKLRDPDAHRRELLPHQKNLALGIAGEIRTKLIRYRSKLETKEDYFPRIESARDSLGNIWVARGVGLAAVVTDQILRPGDVVDFVVTASDPFGQELQFRMKPGNETDPKWQTNNSFSLMIVEQHIGKLFSVRLEIKSPRTHHAVYGCDDYVDFYYVVLPKK